MPLRKTGKMKGGKDERRENKRREGGCRGMERGHDVSCPYERREKRGREKLRRENRRRGEQGDVEGLAGFAMAW